MESGDPLPQHTHNGDIQTVLRNASNIGTRVRHHVTESRNGLCVVHDVTDKRFVHDEAFEGHSRLQHVGKRGKDWNRGSVSGSACHTDNSMTT
jgi:hypothetical protein